MGKKRKKKPPATPLERLKNMPLWQWGLIVIFAGVVSNVVQGIVPGGNSAYDRGREMGRAVGTLFFVVLGIILIILHFVRKRR